MKNEASLLLLLGLIGCTAAPEKTWKVRLDPSLDADERASCETSLYDWRGASPCGLSFEIEDAPAGPVGSPLPSDHTIEVTMGEPPPGEDGDIAWPKEIGGESRGARMVLRRQTTVLGRVYFERVVRHEMGHAFGLAHDDRECAIMNSTMTWGGLTSLDGEDFGARWCSGSDVATSGE